MPKQKKFLKRAGQQKSTSLESANEYLAAGVDVEEAGEKWRAGDAAKSMRFFVRAIDNYEEGLRKFPQSFDLAYNKARLQYAVTQQPRLLAHLPTPLLDSLRLALDTHRVAMKINPDNANLLFNTAQVLNSLAEVTSDGRTAIQTNRDEALHLFQEALEIFQRCLGIQEFQLTEQVTVADENSIEEDGENLDMVSSSTSETSENGRWATIVEPVTKDILVDTALAQLETLAAVCNLVGSEGRNRNHLAWIEEYYRNILRDKIALYVDGTDRHQEAARIRAKFLCALLDASFRSGELEVSTYERELAAAYDQASDISNDPHCLCDRADSEITFITSVQAFLHANLLAQSEDLYQINTISWKHLTMALNDLAAASKLPEVHNLPRIHLRRGDCELLRYRLGEEPASYDVAIKSAATLIKNAEVYYRGSARLARNEGAADEEREASVKEVVAAGIASKSGKVSGFANSQMGDVTEVIEDMRDEGLLSNESMAFIDGYVS